MGSTFTSPSNWWLIVLTTTTALRTVPAALTTAGLVTLTASLSWITSGLPRLPIDTDWPAALLPPSTWPPAPFGKF